MGLLESIFLKTASDKKLAKEREKIRVKENSSYDDKKYDKYFWELGRYDNEMIRRANKKYKKENPNAKHDIENMVGIYQTMMNRTQK